MFFPKILFSQMVFHLRSACYSGPEKAVKSWKGPYGSLTPLHLHQGLVGKRRAEPTVGGFTGEILSTLAATGNSLKLVGLLFSICELLHSTYFRELVSIYGRRASL